MPKKPSLPSDGAYGHGAVDAAKLVARGDVQAIQDFLAHRIQDFLAHRKEPSQVLRSSCTASQVQRVLGKRAIDRDGNLTALGQAAAMRYRRGFLSILIGLAQRDASEVKSTASTSTTASTSLAIARPSKSTKITKRSKR